MAQGRINKKRVITGILAVLAGVVMLTLMVLDINNTVSKTLAVYTEEQAVIAETFLNSAATRAQNSPDGLTNYLKSVIEEQYRTSSSTYCIIAKNDKIVFLKDENTSSTLNDEKISTLFDEDNISVRDEQKYIKTSSEYIYQGETYSLTICIRENYLVKKLGFDEMRIHSMGYFIIYGIALMVIIFYSFYKLRSREKKIRIIEEEIKSDRQLIEKLENDKKKSYVNSEKAGEYSFYDRDIVEDVIAKMSEEKKSQCIQIEISVKNLKMEHFVLTTAILGRIREGNSIACYWGENIFRILLFNAKNEDAEKYLNLFISKYKAETREKVEDLDIVATRLSKKSQYADNNGYIQADQNSNLNADQ